MSNDGPELQMLPIEREVEQQTGKYVDHMDIARQRVVREKANRVMDGLCGDCTDTVQCDACHFNHPLECHRASLIGQDENKTPGEFNLIGWDIR